MTDNKLMPQSRLPTVVIVEANRAVARLMQSYLQAAGFHVPNPAHNAVDAMASLVSASPDAIVMDLALGDDSRAMRELTAAAVERRTSLIYAVATVDRPTLERVVDLQAVGCVVKPIVERQLVSTVLFATTARRRFTQPATPSRLTPEEKLKLIAAVVSDGPYENVRGATVQHEGETTNPHDQVNPLSPRERQIVELLASGARVVTVAQRLQLSPHTVRNHLKSVFRKLNLRGQHELFEYWHEHAW